MKKIKLLLSFLCCACFVGGLTACFDNSESGNDDPSNSQVETPTDLPVSLTGFETSSAMIVEPGTSVEVTDPLTLDEYGNVLSVAHTVVDKNGEEVELDLDHFFAMDGQYTITFKVKDSAGEEHAIQKKVYVMESVKDEGTNLVSDELDLSSYKPSEIPDGYTVGYSFEQFLFDGKTVETEADVVDDKITIDGLVEGYYQVNVLLQSESDLFVYRTFNMDLYSSAKLSWNNHVEQKYAISYDDWSVRKYPLTVEEQSFSGEAEDWFKATRTTESQTLRFTVLPIHSKEYYQIFEGQNVNLMFDYYYQYDVSAGKNTIDVTYMTDNIVSATEKTVYTASISLDSILSNWDNIINPPTNSMSNANSLFRVVSDWWQPITCWFGNFRMTEPENNVTPDTIISKTEKLIDVKGLNTFDVLTALSETEKTTLSGKNLQWSLKSGTETVSLDGTMVEISDIKMKSYTLVAKTTDENEFVLYSGTVDFYDSTQSAVWNNCYETDYVFAWRGSSSNKLDGVAEVVTLTESLDGKDGTFYKLSGDQLPSAQYLLHQMHYNVLGQHTKAYYELYKDYTLVFDYKVPNEQYYSVDWTKTEREGTSVWRTARVPMQTLLDNWDYLTGKTTTSAETQSMFYATGLASNGEWGYAYIGNFSIQMTVDTITKTLSLNDVKDKTTNGTYTLTNLLTTEEKAIYDQYAAMGEVSWTMQRMYANFPQDVESSMTYVACGTAIVCADGVADFATNGYGIYELKAVVAIDGLNYPLFVGQYDFYDSSKAPEWIIVDEAHKDYVWGWSDGNGNSRGGTSSVVTVNNAVDGKQGSFYQVITTDTHLSWGINMRLNIRAMHTKAYYELYKDYTLKFDYYVTGPYNATGYSANENKAGNAWYTAEVSVETLLNSWVVAHGWWNNGEGPSALLFTSGMYPTNCAYIGNFQMVAPETQS